MNVNIYWASAANADGLAPVQIELPLSADPAQRCRQLVEALILSPPTPGQRTLPADATLLDFYLLPDGTAIADFADTLSTGTPSGILSEQLAVDSITQTLASSVPQVRRLKILLHGQEADTLAGHVDLTVIFPRAKQRRRRIHRRPRRQPSLAENQGNKAGFAQVDSACRTRQTDLPIHILQQTRRNIA